MLHYSNASSIEKNRRYLVIKGGLASKLCCTGRRVVGDVVVLGGISAGLGVYRGRRGGRNSKYGANKASQNITRQYAVLGKP